MKTYGTSTTNDVTAQHCLKVAVQEEKLSRPQLRKEKHVLKCYQLLSTDPLMWQLADLWYYLLAQLQGKMLLK